MLRARVELTEWIRSYAKAWETADEDLIASLFTEDASYRSSPFREPFRGHEEIRAYWRRGAGTQRETRVRMGTPFGKGRRVAVEWWTTMVDEGETVTLPGCLLLRFAPDGRCVDLREYWNLERRLQEPFAGWGT
jgi:nuclear transport factor 2 (NTF2) superfamily protein